MITNHRRRDKLLIIALKIVVDQNLTIFLTKIMRMERDSTGICLKILGLNSLTQFRS